MLSYYLKYRKRCRKYKPKTCKDKKWMNNAFFKIMVCGNKKSSFIKEQEAKWLNTHGKILFPPLALFDSIHKK